MRKMSLFLLLTISLLFGAATLYAQEDNGACPVSNQNILEQVNSVCSNVGANEICYGNDQVSIVAHEGVTNLIFDRPGALASLSSIRSLFLSEVNEANNTWGVAQVRLLVNQGNGTQDVTMLLFGDVTVENESETLRGTPTTVDSDTQVFPIAPSQGYTPTLTLTTGASVEAIGRLGNSIWIQIIVPETGENGWVFRTKLDIDDAEVAGLPVKNGDAPLFGSMQALTFASGTSPNCENTTADGMLIQTPQGQARVSFLINEVTIELTGAGNGASAFIQANPDDGEMNVNVLDGTAYVSVNQDTQQVDAGSQTRIPININLNPSGQPSRQQSFDQAAIRSIPLLAVIRDPNSDFVPPANPQISRSSAIASGDASLVVPSGSSSNGSSGGVTINSSSGASNDQSSGQSSNNNTNNSSNTANSGNSSGSSNATNNNSETGNNDTSGVSIPTGGNNNAQNAAATSNDEEEVDPLGVYLRLGLFGGLIVLGIGFVVWTVYYSWRTYK